MPFDFEAYDKKCAALNPEELQREWQHYTRLISSASTSTAVSGLALPLTCGVSLIGVGMAAPAIHNARKKREIIERHLQRHGTTHNTRKRDVVSSMALSGTIGVVTLGVGSMGADAVATAGAEHGVSAIVENEMAIKVATHAALDGAGLALEHAYTGHVKEREAHKAFKAAGTFQAVADAKAREAGYTAVPYGAQGYPGYGVAGSSSTGPMQSMYAPGYASQPPPPPPYSTVGAPHFPVGDTKSAAVGWQPPAQGYPPGPSAPSAWQPSYAYGAQVPPVMAGYQQPGANSTGAPQQVPVQQYSAPSYTGYQQPGVSERVPAQAAPTQQYTVPAHSPQRTEDQRRDSLVPQAATSQPQGSHTAVYSPAPSGIAEGQSVQPPQQQATDTTPRDQNLAQTWQPLQAEQHVSSPPVTVQPTQQPQSPVQAGGNGAYDMSGMLLSLPGTVPGPGQPQPQQEQPSQPSQPAHPAQELSHQAPAIPSQAAQERPQPHQQLVEKAQRESNVQYAAQQAAEPIQEPYQWPRQPQTHEPVRSPVQGQVSGSVHSPVQSSVPDAQNPAQHPVQHPIDGTAQYPVHDSVQDSVQVTAQSSVQLQTQSPAQNAVQSPVQNPGQQSAQQEWGQQQATAEQPVQQPVHRELGQQQAPAEQPRTNYEWQQPHHAPAQPVHQDHGQQVPPYQQYQPPQTQPQFHQGQHGWQQVQAVQSGQQQSQQPQQAEIPQQGQAQQHQHQAVHNVSASWSAPQTNTPSPQATPQPVISLPSETPVLHAPRPAVAHNPTSAIVGYGSQPTPVPQPTPQVASQHYAPPPMPQSAQPLQQQYNQPPQHPVHPPPTRQNTGGSVYAAAAPPSHPPIPTYQPSNYPTAPTHQPPTTASNFVSPAQPSPYATPPHQIPPVGNGPPAGYPLPVAAAAPPPQMRTYSALGHTFAPTPPYTPAPQTLPQPAAPHPQPYQQQVAPQQQFQQYQQQQQQHSFQPPPKQYQYQNYQPSPPPQQHQQQQQPQPHNPYAAIPLAPLTPQNTYPQQQAHQPPAQTYKHGPVSLPAPQHGYGAPKPPSDPHRYSVPPHQQQQQQQHQQQWSGQAHWPTQQAAPYTPAATPGSSQYAPPQPQPHAVPGSYFPPQG